MEASLPNINEPRPLSPSPSGSLPLAPIIKTACSVAAEGLPCPALVVASPLTISPRQSSENPVVRGHAPPLPA